MKLTPPLDESGVQGCVSVHVPWKPLGVFIPRGYNWLLCMPCACSYYVMCMRFGTIMLAIHIHVTHTCIHTHTPVKTLRRSEGLQKLPFYSVHLLRPVEPNPRNKYSMAFMHTHDKFNVHYWEFPLYCKQPPFTIQAPFCFVHMWNSTRCCANNPYLKLTNIDSFYLLKVQDPSLTCHQWNKPLTTWKLPTMAT